MNKMGKTNKGGMMPTQDTPEPDIDTAEESLFQLYLDECYQNKLRPSYKDFKVWLDENYE